MDIPLMTLTFVASLVVGSQGHADHKSWLMDIVSRIVCDGKKQFDENSARVAFSANVGKMFTSRGSDRLVLNEVTLNLGNSYNGSTGIFTCKTPGIYQFNWHMHQTSGTAGLHYYLMQNDAIMFIGHLKDSNDSLSNAKVLSLRAGDRVWIKLVEAGRNILGRKYTTFSGALLYKTSK